MPTKKTYKPEEIREAAGSRCSNRAGLQYFRRGASVGARLTAYFARSQLDQTFGNDQPPLSGPSGMLVHSASVG